MKSLITMLVAGAFCTLALVAPGIARSRSARASGESGHPDGIGGLRTARQASAADYVFDAWTGELVSAGSAEA